MELQEALDLIPIRHNFVTYFTSWGVTLSIILCFVIFFRVKEKNSVFQIFAWLTLFQSLIVLDIYLCYSGLMKYTLWFNDGTEPFVLMLAPLLYLFVKGVLLRKPFTWKKEWYHFIPAIVYGISQIGFYIQPLSVKLNAYIGAYFPDIEFVEVSKDTNYYYHHIKDQFRWYVLLSFSGYSLASLFLIRKYYTTHFKQKKNDVGKYIFTRNTTIAFFTALLLILIIFLNFDDDGGDHIIAIFQSIVVTITVIALLSGSKLFDKSWLSEKYETSGYKSGLIAFSEIKQKVEENEIYLSDEVSLKQLGELLGCSPNYISQLINSETHLNFNEFINQYRINEAKKRLISDQYTHLTVEAIANSVGFKSKSAFYTAFKKQTDLSPKEYMKKQDKKMS